MAVMPSVSSVDDDLATLKALKRLLSAEGFEVQLYSSATAFLSQHDPTTSGCVILDLQLPDLNGLEVQQALISAGEQLVIIFLSGHGDIPQSVQAMKLGAVDFLTKPVDAQELLAAVRKAIEKDRLIRESSSELQSLQERFVTLTAREKEVFLHVVRGELNKEIALKLNVVEKTVKVHRARVIEKMHAHSLADLVKMSERLRTSFVLD
jgi:FixJ family two-component response regulator